MKSTFKRRQYPVVFRDRQYRMLAMVLLYSFTLVAILFVFLFLPDFYQMQNEAASIELRAQAADRVLMLHARLWPAILAVICLIGLHSFRSFLLFIGPLKRLRWAFDNLKAGDLTVKVFLRAGDLLTEEGESLNNTIRALSAEVQKVKAAAEATRSALKGLFAEIEALPQDVRSRLAGNLQALQGNVDDEQRCLDHFRTPELKTGYPDASGDADAKH